MEFSPRQMLRLCRHDTISKVSFVETRKENLASRFKRAWEAPCPSYLFTALFVRGSRCSSQCLSTGGTRTPAGLQIVVNFILLYHDKLCYRQELFRVRLLLSKTIIIEHYSVLLWPLFCILWCDRPKGEEGVANVAVLPRNGRAEMSYPCDTNKLNFYI
jgi:hypothetical protein